MQSPTTSSAFADLLDSHPGDIGPSHCAESFPVTGGQFHYCSCLVSHVRTLSLRLTSLYIFSSYPASCPSINILLPGWLTSVVVAVHASSRYVLTKCLITGHPQALMKTRQTMLLCLVLQDIWLDGTPMLKEVL